MFIIGLGGGLAILSNPLFRKFAIYGAIAFGAFLLYRWHTNSIYEAGVAKGEIQGIEKLTEQKEAEWKETEEALELEWQRLKTTSQELEAQKHALNQNRITIRSDLRRGIKAIEDRLQQGEEEVAQIPPSELNGTIRNLLAALRDTESLPTTFEPGPGADRPADEP